MKVTVNESTLTNIADAIREKEGSGNVYYPSEMGEAIRNLPSGGNEPTDEELTYSGDCSYAFKSQSWLIDKYGDRITTNNITDAARMFYACQFATETIPFELNFLSGNKVSLSNMFAVSNIAEVPKLNNCKPDATESMFYRCTNLRYIPEDFGEDFDWSVIESATSGYTNNRSGMFQNCYSLRRLPMEFLNHNNEYVSYSYSIYSGLAYSCYSLDELVDLPVTGTKTTWTGNAFSNTCPLCNRLQNFTFATNNGEPYVVNWKNQNIDLSTQVGWAYNPNTNNSGITSEKRVGDDATYQALKNDPDWYTNMQIYSRYNHDSAVATINSLPDASAYLASAGGSNTIKFAKANGTNTDGGAIDTLTPEEISVAEQKGWTVALV